MSETVLAHGIGTRADLPLPIELVVIGGGVAVVVSFLVLLAAWREPRLRGAEAGRPLPVGLQGVLDSSVLTFVLRAVLLVALVVVITAGLFGDPSVPRNVAPWALFVTFWVGLVPISLLLGPVWGRVNPLRLVHAALVPLVGRGRDSALLDRLGLWPAAVALAVFAWVELASPERSDPRRVGFFVLGYVLLQLIAACWFGQRWFAAGDGFEVYSRLIGRLSPLGRRSDGALVLRSPLDGAAAEPTRPGLTAVLLVLIGSTGFDGLTRTTYWQSGPGADGDAVLASTAGLVVCTAVVTALYLAATRWLGADTPGVFAHSLIPIAVGYAIAHYFSLLVFDGQTTYVLASDPYGSGLNLFGTAGKVVNYEVVSARTISLVQVAAIVVGHVVAAVLAHDRALSRTGSVHPVRDQVPLLGVMVVFTLAGLGLLLGG